jgi:hypothetical protein
MYKRLLKEYRTIEMEESLEELKPYQHLEDQSSREE